MGKKRTLKQARASRRNWAKAQIVGMIGNWRSWPTTPEESILLKGIENLKQELLNQWDTNTPKVLEDAKDL